MLNPEDLAELQNEYASILDRIAPQLVAKGSLSELYDHLPFEHRYTAMLSAATDPRTGVAVNNPYLQYGRPTPEGPGAPSVFPSLDQ